MRASGRPTAVRIAPQRPSTQPAEVRTPCFRESSLHGRYNEQMECQDAIRRIKEKLPEFKRDYGVAALAVFGSTARGQASPSSDVDILVDFITPPKFRQFMRLKFALEELLGGPVDLVDRAALRPQWRAVIEEEALVA